jgi:hypothetical protein
MNRPKQGVVVFSGLLALVSVGVVVQLWLLSLSVDAIFRGDPATPLHAAIGSLVLFLINGALLLYLFAFDARTRRS